ncbi:MAG: alpha/beta hydrolase [Firmicutes bacterium]|nr:alpha/beta hydrolase [Bacillota bacterium]
MSKRAVKLWRQVFESGDEKRLAGQIQDLSDLVIHKDIPYLPDGDRGHLLDIYERPELSEDAPVMVNIHGGGLFASYKEVNANFNYEWARMGYRVVSLSYRRIPEVKLWNQIDDVMRALRFLKEQAGTLCLNLDRCYLTGDSAGALLSLFVLCINSSEKLQKDFGISGLGFSFKKAGLISIMLKTQRKDFMFAINDVITDELDKGKHYEKYLLDPGSMVKEVRLVPLMLVSSAEDAIRKDTLALRMLLLDAGCSFQFLDFPKGIERKLIHVFSVQYPMYPESREVFDRMSSFFLESGSAS